MAATGSNVAPRSIGSLFSPMERAKKRYRKSLSLYMKGIIQDNKNQCAVHLGVRSVAVLLRKGGK